jgi:uncharacterized membrane protein
MKHRWITPVLLAALWAFALAVYARLPARVPTHWNLRGEVNGWGGPGSAFLIPAIATAMAALILVLPRIDPRREHWARFRDVLHLTVNVLVLFLGWVEVLALGSALGWKVDVTRATLAGVGVLLMVLGNYMPRIRSNWFMGIRTPWTLESERVWRETHRVGGRTFVAGGAVATVAVLLLPAGVGEGVALAALAAASVVPVVYSYVSWRRERA